MPFAYAQAIWDYLCLHQPAAPADLIVGFGCYNEDIPRRAAQLYRDGFAPRILFTGGLGRNTSQMWTEPEARRFARIAMESGVPKQAILIEDRSTNTAENILFTKQLLQEQNIPVSSILGVHKPYMERRIAAAFPVYWPEMEFRVTSYQQTMEQYMTAAAARGRSQRETIDMLVGDLQRMTRYAELGYQIPQEIPDSVQSAAQALISMGYTSQMI